MENSNMTVFYMEEDFFDDETTVGDYTVQEPYNSFDQLHSDDSMTVTYDEEYTLFFFQTEDGYISDDEETFV
jgi:hypothetical protein